MTHIPDLALLNPLSYHHSVKKYLHESEPEVWAWGSQRVTREDSLESLRAFLLRDTYRIEPDAHVEVHEALALAMQRLDIHVPVTLYQSPGQEMNASLFYVPGEVHIVAQGALLDKLSRDELIAVFGHELAHYVLWSKEDRDYFIADRILNDTLMDHAASPSHRETYRRYALYTELFADRGAAIASGALAPAVSALVKVVTGMTNVDATAYLRQAAEIELAENNASAALSHPETFLRVRALEKWCQGDSDLEAWLEARLQGPLILEQLDLPGQVRLQGLSRGLLSQFLADTPLASEALLAQIALMFPDWTTDEPRADLEALSLAIKEKSVQHYMHALLMDIALADPDQQDAALLRAGQVAVQLGTKEAWIQQVKRDAGMDKRALDRYTRQLAKEKQ